MTKTINYYNQNVKEFYARTIHANISAIYEDFLRHLSNKSHILDADCGIGRDAKYF